MEDYARVIEDRSYVRDLRSNAIISTDRVAYENRRRLKQQRNDKNTLEKTVEELLKRVTALEERLALLDG
ncbi:hypothetical protein PP939_gp074 [Rhizobium phage RL38J1]|uniref:Uncharacterized protein n=1 Tax=Rhizobium phage RL38J1 TaxID=2663232 RepID=A0A6B9J1E3_9CAUD|nr:hypothetical protein PP939_gp074 [Rhizobium phage RL38J1]QGZ14064.1 hypothetical protein RL38J1_074 [Rhizobium phage RL38J1]